MLKPNQLNSLPDNLVELYAQAEIEIIEDMARRISKYDFFIPAAEWQYKKLLEMGGVHNEIMNKISKITGKSKHQLERMMYEAAEKSLQFDDKIYKSAGLSPAPITQSPALMNVLNTGIDNTNGLFKNLTKTTAKTATKQFEHALDNAYMQVTTGAFDYNTAIRNSIKNLTNNGLNAINYPSGKKANLEVAVRRAVVTGVGQTTGKIQEARADEMGCDLMEITAHEGARPDHASWQGKIVSRSGKKGYLSLQDIGYGTGAGFKGWNCRHDWFPFFEGISESAYTDEELRQYNVRNIDYNGEKLTEYEASQKQRHIERNIRRWKREYKAMEAAGLPTDEAVAKISKWQNIEKDFVKQTGLKKQVDRGQISGFGKNDAAKVAQVTKKINELNKIPGIQTSNNINITELSKHFGERAVQRNLSAGSVKNALTNPLKIGKIREDGTQQFIGEQATIAVNVQSGKITTAWPTSSKKIEKLKKELDKNDSKI